MVVGVHKNGKIMVMNNGKKMVNILLLLFKTNQATYSVFWLLVSRTLSENAVMNNGKKMVNILLLFKTNQATYSVFWLLVSRTLSENAGLSNFFRTVDWHVDLDTFTVILCFFVEFDSTLVRLFILLSDWRWMCGIALKMWIIVVCSLTTA